MVEVAQLFKSGDDLRSAEVDAAQDDMMVAAGLDISLQRRLTIELDGEVDDVAALHKAEGRGVSPATGDVDAHRAATPYYLVGVDRETGMLLLGEHGLGEAFAQQTEGTALALGAVLAIEPLQLGAEHGIVDAGEQRLVGRQRCGLGYVVGGKLMGGIVEVYLIEHAVGVVVGEERPVLRTVFPALLDETTQIGLGRNLVGAETPGLVPYHAATLLIRLVEHPSQHKAGVVDIVDHGEDAGRLQVVLAFDGGGIDAALFGPAGEGFTQVFGHTIGDVAAELVVEAIGAYGVALVADGHDVDTLAGTEFYLPLVAGHTSDDILMGYGPLGAHTAVFNPEVLVVFGDFDFHFRVLGEHGGMGLERVVHDLALVVDDILDVKHRRDYLMRRTEVIELSAGQRQYGHLEVVDLGVVDGGVGAETAAKLAVHVIVGHLAVAHRAAHEHLDGAVGQQPHADVGQIEMLFLQLTQRLHRWLLKHTLELGGSLVGRDKDAVVLGYFGSEPQAIAHHVGIGDGLERLGSADVDIAADNHRAQTLGRLVHDALIEGHLQGEQVLRQALAALPSEHGNGREYLARRGV